MALSQILFISTFAVVFSGIIAMYHAQNGIGVRVMVKRDPRRP
jgi:hypothetical protein